MQEVAQGLQVRFIKGDRKYCKQESPSAGNRKRRTAHGITCHSVTCPGGTPFLAGGTPS